MKLLHLIAAPRGEQSRTLQISTEFLKNLKSQHADLEVEELDLFQEELPQFNAHSANAMYASLRGETPANIVEANWDRIIAYSKNFLTYDLYLISSPMWNFTVPYKLKHFIDIILQPGIMFQYTETGVDGLNKNKKMFCITSRGNDYREGGPMEKFEFLEPYLRSIFGLTGIYDVTFINANGMDFPPEISNPNLAKAIEDAKAITVDA